MTVDQPIVPPIRAPLTDQNGVGAPARDWWLFFHQLQLAIGNLAALLDQMQTDIGQMRSDIQNIRVNAVTGATGLTHPNVVTKVGAAGEIVEGGITDKSAANSGRVTITAAGDVGIGVDPAAVRLHVRKGNSGLTPNVTTGMFLENDSTGNAYFEAACPSTKNAGYVFSRGTSTTAYIVDSASGFLITAPSDQPMIFSNSVERMRIEAAGKVGIGTASPAFSLTVNGDIALVTSSGALRFVTASGVNYLQSGATATGGSTQNLSIGPFQSATPYIYIKAAGNVGIGTGAPGYALDVAGECNASFGYRAGGVPVVSARRAAVGLPSGGTVIDIQARNSITDLINRLSAATGGHGLIA